MRSRLAVVGIGVALAAAACSGDGSVAGLVPRGGLAAALVRFDACDDLLDHLRTEAAARVGPYGLDGGVPWLAARSGVAVDDAGGAEAIAGSDGDAGASTAVLEATADVSGTNVQEAGVDEPDLVKADAGRILAVAGGRLHYVDVSGAAPVRRGSVEVPEGGGAELLVDGDRALLLVRVWRGDVVPFADDGPATGRVVDMSMPAGTGTTVLAEVDLSDPDDLEVVATMEVEGTYVSARQVGTTARVVVRSEPDDLGFVQPASGGAAAEEEAVAVNRRVVEESSLEQWLPSYTMTGGGDGSGMVVDCDQVYRPPSFSGFGILSVLTVDLAAPLAPADATAVVAPGDVVYASPRSVYVATTRWDAAADGEGAGDLSTEVHRFAIDEPGVARYRASGAVPGTVLNQFSMSEHEETLRVATTEPGDGDGTSTSAVRVLAEDDGALVEVGAVGDLGRGEQIFAVRFMGDVGYVVTFRQTDPLYALDLSDPAAPALRGELKVNGYSAYLHPLDDGLLLGVGQDADDEGRTTGAAVSLFDVSDLGAPSRLQHTVVPDAMSAVEWDHRAFLWWPATRLAVVPIEEYRSDRATTGAVGYAVTVDGIREVGRVTHPGEYSPIHRSVVVGDSLYTVSEAGVQANDLTTLAPGAWVPLG